MSIAKSKKYINSALNLIHITQNADILHKVDNTNEYTTFGCGFISEDEQDDYCKLILNILQQAASSKFICNKNKVLGKKLCALGMQDRIAEVENYESAYALSVDVYLMTDTNLTKFLINKKQPYIGSLSSYMPIPIENTFIHLFGTKHQFAFKLLNAEKNINIQTPFDIAKLFYGEALDNDELLAYYKSSLVKTDAFIRDFVMLLQNKKLRELYVEHSLKWLEFANNEQANHNCVSSFLTSIG